MVNFSLLFKYNLIFSSFLFCLFLFFNSDYTLVTIFLTVLGSISSAVILYILLYIFLFLFSFLGKYFLYLIAIIFTLVNMGIIIDFFIFRLYSFHINAMVLNILTSPAALDSIQVGIFPLIIFCLFILAILLIELITVNYLVKLDEKTKKQKNKNFNKKIILPLFFIVLVEKVSYGMASLLNKNEIVSKFNVIPLYQPLTFNRLAAKYFDYKPDVQAKNTINKSATLKYPLNELRIKALNNKFNIIIIASDSVRNSIINKKISPNIEEFKKDSIVFNNHYSGGNATRFGIFSMMYGINSTYWFNFLKAAKGSLLFDVLKRLDYNINIISSTDTNWPEFRKTAYVNILNSIKDDFEGAPWEKDKKSSQYFLDKISSYDLKNPLFTFLFLDAPHGYSFPKEFNKFKATNQNINYLTAKKGTKDSENIFARYKNAVNYNDMLFGKIITKLKDKKLYENSLIIYTSDHGEEFFEQGYFGHNSAFNKAQTNVPFIVKLPKDMIKNTNPNSLTSHVDIVPTLLSLLGVENDTGDYSNGYNVFNKNYKREYVFSANWNNNAIITKENTYIFSNLPNKMFKNEVRDSINYEELKSKKINSKLVLDVINENKRFLK